MHSPLRKAKRFYNYWRIFQGRGVSGYQVEVASSADMLAEAQRLHAKVYLHRRYVKPHQVGPDGRLTAEVDPHRENSVYFVVRRGRQVVAAARQIGARADRGHASFPTYHFHLAAA